MLKRSRACIALAIASLALAGEMTAADVRRAVAIRSNDVVAFVGGADTAAAGFTGHLEALLAVRYPGARFRNFGWEGDTVFAQPRDVGFPPLADHLKRARVTTIFLQFGRAEALNGDRSVPDFYNAYDRLVTQCLQQTARIVLVAPPPFERGDGVLPDLLPRNAELGARANAVRTLAQRRSLSLINLFSALGGAQHDQPRLTDNGLQLSPRGQALVAAAFLREMGANDLASLAGQPDDRGSWPNPLFEKLRLAAIEKHQLWFNYWRPQNWAFLGGDRTTQPSSRDHRDPKVRWFPAEMEKYLPLIRAQEEQMENLAAQIRKTPLNNRNVVK